MSNQFFDVLLIDIPNQINAKSIYIRGQSYPRQMFIREHTPFEWRPITELRRRYEEPLEIFPRADRVAKKQVVMLEFMREEEALLYEAVYPFKREQDKLRKIVIGNSRLKNTPMEKNGAYELIPKVSASADFLPNLLIVVYRKKTSTLSVICQRMQLTRAVRPLSLSSLSRHKLTRCSRTLVHSKASVSGLKASGNARSLADSLSPANPT